MLQDCVTLYAAAWLTACSSRLEQPVRAESTDGPGCPWPPLGPSPSLHKAQDCVSLQGYQSLPQHHHTGAGLQLSCLAMAAILAQP